MGIPLPGKMVFILRRGPGAVNFLKSQHKRPVMCLIVLVGLVKLFKNIRVACEMRHLNAYRMVHKKDGVQRN